MSKTVKNTNANTNTPVVNEEVKSMGKTVKNTKATNTKATDKNTKASTKVNKINGIPESEFQGFVLVTYKKSTKELVVTGTPKDLDTLLKTRRANGETFVISPSVNRIKDYVATHNTKGMTEVLARLEAKFKNTVYTPNTFLEELVNVATSVVSGKVVTYTLIPEETPEETPVEATQAA